MTSGHECRKLVFHIGHQKTGTTTIQNAFAAGRVRIEGRRILYPARMAHNYLKRHVTRFAEEGVIMDGRPGMPGLTAISQELSAAQYDFAVFSGEAFADFKAVHLRKAMDRFFLPHVTDHTVLCYLRPHAARVLSSFVEQTKIGMHSGSILDFHQKALKRERFIYAAKLRPWVMTFGTNFVVRPMVRQELAQGSVLHDFVQAAFGAEVKAQIEPAEDANESLGLEDLMFLKVVQNAISSRDRNTRLELGWAVASGLSERPDVSRKTTKLKLHRALAERIRRDYRDDARRTDERYFGGRPIFQQELDRSVDESVAEEMSVDPSDYYSAAELRGFAALLDVVNDMLGARPKEWPRFFLDLRAKRVG